MLPHDSGVLPGTDREAVIDAGVPVSSAFGLGVQAKQHASGVSKIDQGGQSVRKRFRLRLQPLSIVCRPGRSVQDEELDAKLARCFEEFLDIGFVIVLPAIR